MAVAFAVRTAPPIAGSSHAPQPVASRPDASRIALFAVVGAGALLRLWAARRHVLNLDESLTAMAARRPVGDLLTHLRARDSHPPLDYLLRAPLARAEASDLALRIPSVVFSVAALACLAWWLRNRGWFGVLAVGLMAVSGYQLLYGAEARMYALLGLLGVVAAIVSDSWRTRPTTRLAAIAGVVVLLAVFDHVSGLFLAAGLFTVPGARRDGDAWRWRVAVIAPAALFALAWGPALLEQRGHSHTPAPMTSARAVAGALGPQVTTRAGLAGIVLLAVVAGLWALRRLDEDVCRAALACAVWPFALTALVGLATPILIPRFVAAFGWAVPVAIAAGTTQVLRWSRPVGVLAVLLVVGTFGASAARELTLEWPVDRAVAELREVARPGDVVATSPAWYGAIVDWHLGVRGPDGGGGPITLPSVDDVHAIAVGRGPRTGRVWLLQPVGSEPARGVPSCGPAWTDGVALVRCLES